MPPNCTRTSFGKTAKYIFLPSFQFQIQPFVGLGTGSGGLFIAYFKENFMFYKKEHGIFHNFQIQRHYTGP